MFKEGETVCVSHMKYGYHSMPLPNAFLSEVTLVPPDPRHQTLKVPGEYLTLVALNPIQGFRIDANCTAYRNFLIEMDVGSLKQQLEYIKALNMPYSACVFSGSKSLHFLISLDTDLPNETTWRKLFQWMLNVVTLADQQAKNPSRSIRIPGGIREPGKIQRLVEMKGPVKLADLAKWLSKYEHLKPKPIEKREPSGDCDFSKLNGWAKKKLIDGIRSPGRNQQWFSMGCEMALAGYSLDSTIDILSEFFTEENDFKEREWLSSIKSGFKHKEKVVK